MGPRIRVSGWFATLLICCSCIALPVAAFAANVSTEKSAYVPGEVVVIHGSGWRAGESVSLDVSPGDATNLQATANSSGEFTNSQYVAEADQVGEQMTLTATGTTSGSASTIFANSAANLDQAKNETPDNPDDPVLWVNGDLNANQSHYTEGMSIPYRMVMTDLSNGSHTLIIGWDTKDGNLAALDYLTHYDRLEPHSQFVPTHPAEEVDPLDGLTGPFAGPSTFAIPAPSTTGTPVAGMPLNSFNGLPAGERVLTIWNGTINSVSYNSQDPLNIAHSQSQLTINFTSTAPTAVISWGGHIARTDEWNDLAHPTGSPYHTRLISLDGQGGNQDRALKSEAVFSCEIEGPTPVCASTTNQYCVTTNISGNKTYSWVFTSNTSGATFSGPTNGACVNVNAGTGGSYSLKATVTGADGGIFCEHTFTVNATPSCSITGPEGTVCPSTSQQFCGPVGYTYLWTVTGNGTIDGSATSQCVTIKAGAGCDASYTAKLKVSDGLSCNSTCERTINVKDNTLPVIAGVGPDATIQCPNTPLFSDPTASDNCSTPSLTYNDVTTPGGCAGTYDVTRTWTAKDACNNTATASQTIHVVDTTKPTLSNVPSDATVECDNVPPPANVTASDSCDPDVQVELGTAIIILDSNPPQSATSCTYEITRTWTATDDCGNTATATQKLTVHDSTNPQVASCPADQTIECPNTPEFGTPQFSDNCDTDLTITHNDVTTPSQTCPEAYDVTRTWTAKDNCNNQATCSQTIHVVDTTKPTIANVPADATVECSAVPPPPDNVTASDACDSDVQVELGTAIVILDSNPPQSATSCTYEITRTWTATDDCGNTATASQKLTVHDSTNPQVVSCPADDTIQCPNMPSFGTPQFSDNCDTDLTITHNDVTTPSQTCTQAYDVTRTWTAKDNCNNQATCSQTIHVVDTTKPVIANVPADATVECSAVPPPPDNVTASDACDPSVQVELGTAIVILDSNPPQSATSCTYEITRTWTATDDCGNTATATQKLTVHDSTNPQVASCPADQTIQCPNTPEFGTPQFSDNCDTDLTITHNDVETPSQTCPNAKDVTRTWTAKDNCNNQATCSQTIHIVDTTGPVLTCPGNITVGECQNTVTYNGSGEDACGGAVTISFSPPSGTVFGLGTTTVTMTGKDACGNPSTCQFTVTVTGTPVASITGDDAVCDGQTTQFCGPDGNFSWAWTGPGPFTADTRCITVGVAGTYHLTVTDLANHCTANGSVDLTVNPNPVCSITGPTETCDGTPVQLCGPDGNFGYAWSGPANFHADTKCINVSVGGSYSLVVTDLATKCTSSSCAHGLQVNPCVVNCPRTPGFWAAQCGDGGGGSHKFDTAAMNQISSRVDDKVGIFNWASGTDFARFCSTVTKTGNMDQRLQAKRQFAAFLANVCTGELNLTANNGDHIYIDPNSPVSCSGLTSTTMGGIVTEVDTKLLALEGQSLTSPVVKAAYSQIISCLDGINNAEGASVCASAAAANAEYRDFEASTAALGINSDVVELYRPSPNPFSGSTRIAYVVRGTGERVHIGVYDVAGRRMKVLTDGYQAPGRYETSWDGSSDAGVRANNGVYFVRSIVAGKVQTMRVIYVK